MAVHPEDGAFAERITVKGDLQIKIPSIWASKKQPRWARVSAQLGRAYTRAFSSPCPTMPLP
jgi:hypothetical protein